jgi:hypothetical protein
MDRSNRLLDSLLAAAIVAVVLLCLVTTGGKRQAVGRAPGPTALPGIASTPGWVENVTYRKTSEFDPGTIRVYLRNIGKRELTVKQVLMDGLPISVWGVDLKGDGMAPDIPPEAAGEGAHGVREFAVRDVSNERLIWARLSPPACPPGKVAECSAKLSYPLPRPVKMEFVLATGRTLVAVVRPIPPPLSITGIAFSEELARVYLYLEGHSEEPLEVLGVELDGQRVGKGLWFSSRRLPAGEKGLATIDLDEPLTQGSFVTVRVVCRRGISAEERMRVFRGFPLNMELPGKPPAGYGMDEEPYTVQPAFLTAPKGEEGEAPQAEPGLRADFIFECAEHMFHGSKRRSAQETLRRYDLCTALDPGHPCVTYLCRVRPEAGYARFAETADILRINPDITTALSGAAATPEEVVARVTRYAYLAARPRPAEALADTARFGKEGVLASPDELRRRVYASIGAGAKGLLYRHQGWEDAAAARLNEEIRRINAEVRQVRPYLSIADVTDWVKVQEPQSVEGYSLLAGDRGVVLVFVNHRAAGGAVRAVLSLPDWVGAVSLVRVRPENLEPVQFEQVGGGKLTLLLEAPGTADIYLLKVRCGAGQSGDTPVGGGK